MVAKSLHMDDLVALHTAEKLRHERCRFIKATRRHRLMQIRGKTCAICGNLAAWNPCCAKCTEVACLRQKARAKSYA